MNVADTQILRDHAARIERLELALLPTEQQQATKTAQEAARVADLVARGKALRLTALGDGRFGLFSGAAWLDGLSYERALDLVERHERAAQA